MIEEFEEERLHFLCQALDDAKKWCKAPETLVDGKRSDQFWLQLFSPSSDSVTANDAYCFLVSFQLTNKVTWDRNAVAARINKFRGEDATDAVAGISALAADLSHCITSKKRGRQISAASKIAFFTRPLQNIYIWDRFAKRSAGFRGRRLAGFRGRRSGALVDYASYSAACTKALNEEHERKDLVAAVDDFRANLQVVGGPMADSKIRENSSFIARRLLDKLMFWEGKWLEQQRKGKTGQGSADC